ncbi:conserved hypothetical protein [Uncinocarpus reesii 1704]|uniref:Ras modification protein ERF4 n=1 Tax=Uncinocarpus reesii (strain UAMH 1704) TaxID=336963 RepID=C4JN20_UNCRE|nr:uncharacterized protein UREG_04228 [Uncinocarpus reesii 1704]EEP79382.1 conserved hypothetical protein [Uncinocarpus reesii 1704]
MVAIDRAVSRRRRPYEDIPLVPIIPANRPPAPSIRAPDPSYQPPPRSREFNPPCAPSRNRGPLLSIRTHVRRPVASPWNPINHVPRTTVIPAPRPIPLSNPAPFAESSRDVHPLLTIPERRRSRQQPSPSSLFVERSAGETESGRTSIAIPRQHRSSGTWDEIDMGDHRQEAGENRFNPLGPSPRFLSDPHHDPARRINSRHSAISHTFASFPSANGNASTQDGSGEDGAADPAEELTWGPAHPCFPHMNPHVPLHSAEYQNTRVIRIRRDWMLKGDLAPTFSNLYPEILDPLLPESEFRKIIAKVNREMVDIYNPFSLQNWVDATIGFLTGWIWDDIGASRVKSRLRAVEAWIDRWNREVGVAEGVKVWPLRSTGYLSLDIQIPDPKVGLIGSDSASIHGEVPNIHGARIDAPEMVQITGPGD